MKQRKPKTICVGYGDVCPKCERKDRPMEEREPIAMTYRYARLFYCRPCGFMLYEPREKSPIVKGARNVQQKKAKSTQKAAPMIRRAL